jgi:N-acetylneuraminic acid mutarotase
MARTGAVGFSIGNKGYIGTGCTELNSSVTTYVKDFWEYDPVADTWTQKADFGGGFTNAAAGFSIGNKGYVGTGSHITYTDGNVVQTGIKEFWQYDPATDTWTQKADFGGSERELAKGFSIGNKGYIGWGQNTGYSSLKEFWEYNPATDTWTRKADTDVALIGSFSLFHR